MSPVLTVQDIAREIVAREGGYVNDPADPGGATNYGVTIHTMRALGLDLTGNGVVDERDVKVLTRAQAEEIFVREYFQRFEIGRLPPAIQSSVFDMVVNAGSNGVKILQRVLNRHLPLEHVVADLVVDGRIGPITARAAHLVARAIGPTALTGEYGIARRDYYYRVADLRPASRKYARRQNGGKGGWIIRAESFITPSLRLTEAQHALRVKAWG